MHGPIVKRVELDGRPVIQVWNVAHVQLRHDPIPQIASHSGSIFLISIVGAASFKSLQSLLSVIHVLVDFSNPTLFLLGFILPRFLAKC